MIPQSILDAPRRSFRAPVRALLRVTIAAFVLATPLGARAPRVAEEVRAALARDDRVVVLVECRSARRVRDALGADLATGGARLCHEYRWVPWLLIEVRNEASLERLASLPDVVGVEVDERGRGALDESTPFLGVPAVHALGVRGAGTVVAVLDTGVDSAHPAFAGAIVHEYHVLDQLRDRGVGAPDGHGHGTSVAGVVVSRGVNAPAGIAPEASLVAVKVLDDTNSGWVSDWTAGIEHVLDLHTSPGGVRIDVINMSLSTSSLHDGACDARYRAFADACRRAEELGIIVVAAAGNQGAVGAMPAPACLSPVISVGAIDDARLDGVSTFTNRSTLLDFVAPGERIVSAGLRGGTSVFTGTSQAAPHVAGLLCLLRGIDPALGPEEAARVLRATARPRFDPVSGLDLAVIDGGGAVRQLLAPPAVSGLRCAFVGGTLDVAWEREPRAAAYAVRVERDGVPLLEESLDGVSAGFRYTTSREGFFRVAVSAIDGDGNEGLEGTCSVDGSRAAQPFSRGECDGNGGLQLSDAVFLLNYLFLSGRLPSCLEACNVNGDAGLDVADASYALNFLFLGGSPPAAPYPACDVHALARASSCTAASCP